MVPVIVDACPAASRPTANITSTSRPVRRVEGRRGGEAPKVVERKIEVGFQWLSYAFMIPSSEFQVNFNGVQWFS